MSADQEDVHYAKLKKKLEECERKLENAMAANNALGSSGRERDEVMTRIIKDRDEWKQTTEEATKELGAWMEKGKQLITTALQTHELRKALEKIVGVCKGKMMCLVGAQEPVDKMYSIAREAVVLTSTLAEKRVAAMDHVCEMVRNERNAGTDFYCDDLPEAIAALDALDVPKGG